MENIRLKVSWAQLSSIMDDLDDALVCCSISYGRFHKGVTNVVINFDSCDKEIVLGLIKYRLIDENKRA